MLLVLVLGSADLGLAAEGPPSRAVGLEPGFGIVQFREQRELRIQLDADTQVVPAQLPGQTLVIRRLLKKVYAPQASKPLAEEWQVNGTAEVLPTQATGGALVATLLWEDEKKPVKPGDRTEFCRPLYNGPDAAKPVLLSLQCVPPRRPTGSPRPEPAEGSRPKGADPAVGPAEEVWLVADLVCPTGEHPQCQWTADAGEFVYAGGASAGKAIEGPFRVRWRAPVALEKAPLPDKATVRLKVSTRWYAQSIEAVLAIRIAEPKGPYVPEQRVAARVPGVAGSRPGPLFAEAGLIAAGTLGSFYLADSPNHRLLHWSQEALHYAALERAPVAALETSGDTAWFVQGKSLFRWNGGAEKPTKAAGLPDVKSLVGLRVSAVGDLYVLDAAPPRVLRLPGAEGAAWQEALLDPKVDAPGLTSFSLDPLSNDLHLFDSKDRMLRPWRASHALSYHLLPVAAPIGPLLDQFGPIVEIAPRPDCDRGLDLPVRLLFKSGAFTERWTCKGTPPRWEPVISRLPQPLAGLQFVPRRVVPLPDGDLLLGGQGTCDDEAVPLVAQLSPRGEFRRLLPLPDLPPRLVTVASNGLRYVLHARSRSQRLVRLDADGWVVQDLGTLEGIRPIVRVRADRSSPEFVFVVGEMGGRDSAIRISVQNPKQLQLELAPGAIPNAPIPRHRATDVATSPEHVLVLDRDGKVLLFANERPIRYLGEADTGLRRPAAIALSPDAPKRRAPGIERQTYFCVLPSGREAASIHLWRFRVEGGTKPVVVKVGVFPDPKRSPAAVLSSPVTMDTGFPDRAELLYVLDRGGAQVRVFDVPDIAAQLAQGLVPDLTPEPILDKLPFEGGRADLAIGPGQVIHIADETSEAVHSFTRRP